MEIELVSSSNQGVIVYVSDNCTEEYDLEQTLLPSTSAGEPGEPDQLTRKRRSAESIQPKCYGWSDVLVVNVTRVDQLGVVFKRFVSV